MKFGIEIYGDGDRKPWEKKERENWARGRGGGGGVGLCTMGVPIYISSLWCIFFSSNLAVCLNCKFPKKIKNVMHTLASILFF